MTLSKSDSSVNWRLNELINASRKAKAFAAADWSHSEALIAEADVADSQSGFQLWAPKVLDTETDGDVDSSAEQVLDEAALGEQMTVSEVEVEPVAEEQPPAAPSFDQQTLDQARSESFDQGYQQAMDEAEVKWASARDEFITFTETLRSAQSGDNDFYQPLKKLALHLAEQLVRGELAQSTAAIERLIDAAIKDIEQQGEGPIVVNLSAADNQQFTAHLSSDIEHLTLRVDPSLSQGSVRITMDDSAVEDLIESRLSALSEKMLGLPEHHRAPASVPKSSTLEQRAVKQEAALIDAVAESVVDPNSEQANPSDSIIDDEIPDA
jgi:flagellar biosynthesis/type III secretory pathway protein FliH